METDITLSESEISLEIDALRVELIVILSIALPLLGWGWLYYTLTQRWAPGPNLPPVLLVCAAALGASLLRRRFPMGAAHVLVLGAILATGSLVLAHPSLLSLCVGISAILIANALLSPWEAIPATALTWGAAMVGGSLAVDHSIVAQPGLGLAALYGLSLGIAWLSMRPLRAAIELGMIHWQLSREAVREARQRRAEVYNVMRSLEEANHRIARMNGELVVARREAEEARTIKARFVATVSHELRGPLNMILGFSRMMALSPDSYGQPLPAEYRADIYSVFRNCQHLLTLVDDILDLSQIEADKMPLVKDRIDMQSDVVEKVVNIVRPLAERKGLRLDVETHDELPWILADPVRLRQALLNLMVNAVHSTEQGHVTVITKLVENKIMVTVQDSGPGIDKDALPRLFGEFTQVLKPGVKPEGSGLGLAISKNLIELHQGEIWVESEKGRGSAFSFTVPLPGQQELDTTSLVSTSPHSDSSLHHTCLVVHDDPDIVRLLSRHIEGYQVVGAMDASAVVDMVYELHPKAVLTSHAAVEAVAGQIAATPYDVPLISCDLPKVAQHYGAQRVLGQVTKPLAPEVLHAVMQRAERAGEMTLLIVDDEPDAIKLLERMLLALPRPYTFLRAYDGEEALQMIRKHKPDVVFLDMVMPGMGGKQVLEALQADPEGNDSSVVVVSGADWVTESTSLGNLYSLTCRRAPSISTGIACLQAMLDTAMPDYLGGSRDELSSVPAPPDQPAFAAPHRHPTPAPGGAD